jgi:hypothetical protein
MPKMSLPPAVVVSIAAPWPGEDAQADAGGGELVHGVDEVPEIAAEPVQLPYNKRIALTKRLQASAEAWSIVLLPGHRVAVEVSLGDTGGDERVTL